LRFGLWFARRPTTYGAKSHGRVGRPEGEPSLEEATRKEPPTRTQTSVAVGDYRVDLEFEFGNEDQTGYLWTWLERARDPAAIVPGVVLTLRDGEDMAIGQIIDLVPAAGGTIVHIELLPGAVEDYLAAIQRATGRQA
jgi:hypothetical protein